MGIDRAAHIGVVSEPRVFEINRHGLQFFAKATGETDPVYYNESAAQAAGHPGLPAPPTYLFAISHGVRAKRGDFFDPINGLGLDMARVLHGEQSFAYHRPLYAGDRVTLTTTTRDIFDKKNGALEFIVQDTEAANDDGELCAVMTTVLVVRND